MIKMLPAVHEPAAYSRKHWMDTFGLSKEAAKRAVESFQQERVFKSECGTYQCNVRDAETWAEGWPPMIHLSIKRVDREAFHDWRVLQDIKNSVLSPEHEAVELYPADSRLWDTANQYHLWAFADPRHGFPFGFRGRVVMDDGEGPGGNAKQRPLGERSA
jgi:hypothetical protein